MCIFLVAENCFPGGATSKEPTSAGDVTNPWVGKTPWRRAWQPTPVFLAAESHGQRSLKAIVHGVSKCLHTMEVTCTQACLEEQQVREFLCGVPHTQLRKGISLPCCEFTEMARTRIRSCLLPSSPFALMCERLLRLQFPTGTGTAPSHPTCGFSQIHELQTLHMRVGQ